MYHPDKPITKADEDLLGRSSFAKQLAQSLLLFDNPDTFTIALYGKWGYGKTSVVNMMVHELMEEEESNEKGNSPIIVRFDPWNFADTNQLLAQFFVRLSNEFLSNKDKHLQGIGVALEKYSDAFELANPIPVFGSLISFVGKKGLLSLGKRLRKGADEKDISKQKENVMDLLEAQSCKVIIIIDDIDRLSNVQIRQVFQLVTSVARFPNTIYLLAFDRDVVVKALEAVQEGDGNEYLEKVIQVPIQIPDIQNGRLKDAFFNRLNSIIESLSNVNFNSTHWQKIFEPCVAPYVRNLRDVHRLCNLIQFKLAALASEVDFADVVAMSALEINRPEIFEWIKENKTVLTSGVDLSIIAAKKSQKEWKEIYSTQLQEILKPSITSTDLSSIVEQTINFLTHLFPYFGQKIGNTYELHDADQLRANNQIAHADKFDRYFHLSLSDVGLKRANIENAIQLLDYDSLVGFLIKQDHSGLVYEFLEEVKARLPYITSLRAKIIAKALFETAYQFDSQSQKNIFIVSATNYAELLIRKLIDIIDDGSRMEYISDILSNANPNKIQTFATFLNTTELAFGRLAANGEEKSYEKLLSLQDLVSLETLFCQSMRRILLDHNVLDFRNAYIIIYLLEHFDANHVDDYLSRILKADSNKIKYLQLSVSKWTGSGVEYEVNNNYEKHLTKEQVMEAIERLKSNGEWFDLPAEIQDIGCAFFLAMNGQKNYHGNISQKDIDELIKSWE